MAYRSASGYDVAPAGCGKPFVIFGTVVPALRKVYEAGHSVTVYEGSVCVDGTETYGWVYSVSVADLWPYFAQIMRYKALRPLRRRARIKRASRAARRRLVIWFALV